ncbi:SDR family NAD(P)-dependent oxidoreductase [Streptomyces sp. NPDC051987]|uniref:SDR family NAD(P)-dependent oxidoreductase n=1 Tax=Streptomyces sp. NPDC051987 TaxID=3155808 RepID=UPI00344299BE
MPTIAVIGAGPGMGLAIARTFGSRGFDVALIARTKDKLQALVDQLGQEGITAEAFPADVLDRPSLTAALDAVKARFGGVDVLEYSPAPHSPVPGHTLAVPSEATPDNLQPQIEYNLYGAITAAQAVLPAMREAGAGSLLFTTGGGSVDPVPMLGNVNAAAAALRNWVINLKQGTDRQRCARRARDDQGLDRRRRPGGLRDGHGRRDRPAVLGPPRKA